MALIPFAVGALFIGLGWAAITTGTLIGAAFGTAFLVVGLLNVMTVVADRE